METSEIMINDWISYSNEPFQIDYFHRTTGTVGLKYRGKSEYYQDGVVCIEDISPILLTPELLEKNGWQKHATYGSIEEDGVVEEIYMLYEYNFEVVFSNKEPISIRHFVQTDDDGYDKLLIESRDNTMGVHVLQHAFRLYGLSDVANSFKVR